MIVKAPTVFVAVPLAVVLTAAATVVILETPWNALPGVFGGMVTTCTGPLVAFGHIVTEPDVAQVAVTDTPAAVLDTATVIELPETTSAPTLSASEPNEVLRPDRILQKPFTTRRLLERVRRILEADA